MPLLLEGLAQVGEARQVREAVRDAHVALAHLARLAEVDAVDLQLHDAGVGVLGGQHAAGAQPAPRGLAGVAVQVQDVLLREQREVLGAVRRPVVEEARVDLVDREAREGLVADARRAQRPVEHVRVVGGRRRAIPVVVHELVDPGDLPRALARAVVVDVVVVGDRLLVRHLGHVLLEDDELGHALGDAHEAHLGLGAVELRVPPNSVAPPLGPQAAELAVAVGAAAAPLAPPAAAAAGLVRQERAAHGRLDLVVAHRRRAGLGEDVDVLRSYSIAVVEDDDAPRRGVDENLDERRAVLHRVLYTFTEQRRRVHAGVDRVRHEAHVRRRHDAAPLEDAVRVDAAALHHRAPVGPALLVGADPRERRLRAEPAAVLVLEREVGVARPLLRELLDVGPRRLCIDAEALGLDFAVGGVGGVVEELDLVLLVHVLVAVGVAAGRGSTHGCYFSLRVAYIALFVCWRDRLTERAARSGVRRGAAHGELCYRALCSSSLPCCGQLFGARRSPFSSKANRTADRRR
mmetsp:Transcript_5222/g.15145  ORF Transcript_5222/g.15145 Transcript_5222/m.15145 type:complete len:519 (-) Transcript_5222:462-2018(-)